MIKIVDDCVDCGLPCIGSACPYKNMLEYYCDNCGVSDTLYYFDGEELCLECILKSLDLRIVEGTDW